MEFKNYYQILGVARGATAEEIKRAYRRLARRYHPDVSREPDSEERFKKVAEAFEVLRDPERRAAYDRMGARRQPRQEFPPPNWNDAPFGFGGNDATPDELGAFSQFFDSMSAERMSGGRSRRRGGGFQARGRDHHAKVAIDLEDAFHSATSSFTLRLPDRDRAGQPVTRERVLSVRIPPGIREGQQIRLAGQGEPGAGGSPAGDLYLEIRFNLHPLYRVEGGDLYVTLPIAPWEAALGASVKAPTPGGAVEVRIPAGSQAGKQLRLKGRGMPGSPPGDLCIVLQIALPPADSERAREIYRTMARELKFNPRESLGK